MSCLVTIKLGWRTLPALLLVLGCSIEQPRTRCTTAQLPFALKYTKVDGNGSCGELTGDIAGVQSYWREDPMGGKPSVTRGAVAIRTDEIGALITEYGQAVDPEAAAALGSFTTDEPDADGFCAVTMAKPAALTLPAVPPKLPPVQLTLEWSNVRFYVTAAQPGTIFSARLKYTKTTEGEACTATYDVAGLAPFVECEATENVRGSRRGTGEPNEDACHPCADSAKRRSSGSGISPGIDIVCDAETLTCVPRNAVPSLRSPPLQCTE